MGVFNKLSQTEWAPFSNKRAHERRKRRLLTTTTLSRIPFVPASSGRHARNFEDVGLKENQMRYESMLKVSGELPRPQSFPPSFVMASISVKLFTGETFPLLSNEQRAAEALTVDGCILLLGAALHSPELAHISLSSTIALLGGDSSQPHRIEVEGGRYIDANGGDILVCQPTRTFELVRPLPPPTDAEPRRATKAPKSFFCPVSGCTSSFNRRDNLRRHLRDPTRGPRHAEYAKELDASLPQSQNSSTSASFAIRLMSADQISVVVERLSSQYPAIALVPEVTAFEEVQGLEEKLAAVCRSLFAVFRREFGGFDLWGEVRIGGGATGEAGSSGSGAAN
ncbi:hypothetical protein FN846DRAFT_888690 [Sphaerosporella brunnea]|uniref:C2H2-type domain-containing protein n=1 Tax=Sphaerosporella brunnea TaxID=1250544 RepID=A0A5J5F230_9PEZI|nr:hypothetical protein FN846DRAFT_888690 [Sphaerosporella brunnea]